MKTNVLWLLSIAVAGCGSFKSNESDPPAEAVEHPAVTEARATFPRFAELQHKVFSSTCAPNPGVCHNSSNYPNLETPGNSIAWVGAACNPEIPNPLDGWDACEKEGHVLVADVAGPFRTGIAWIEKTGAGAWNVRFLDPAPATMRASVFFESADGEVFYEPPLVVSTDADLAFSLVVDIVEASRDARLVVETGNATKRDAADSILATVRGGDPNHNGTFGAESVAAGALFYPGDLSRSYLWGRITGTVPGSRMPLANAPITLPGYVAIACWIEGLDDTPEAAEPEDGIDYDACGFADAPIDYTAE